jgi:putative transposase
MFLCAIRDGHSRRVLGHVVADHIGADMVCQAIDAAVACRGGGVAGTVLHSDRGGEFTAALTVAACARHNLKRSMGETGVCWDNSPAESFWSTFKHEYYYRHTLLPRPNSLLRLTCGSVGTTIEGVTLEDHSELSLPNCAKSTE